MRSALFVGKTASLGADSSTLLAVRCRRRDEPPSHSDPQLAFPPAPSRSVWCLAALSGERAAVSAQRCSALLRSSVRSQTFGSADEAISFLFLRWKWGADALICSVRSLSIFLGSRGSSIARSSGSSASWSPSRA